MIKVFGHKSPDTDATCAAISYAWYLGQKSTEAKAYVLGEINREAQFVLKTFNFEVPETLSELSDGDEVAIVDTNNPEELPDSLGNAKILNIVDHHKLAGLTTDSPLEITMKPLGSTSTLVYLMMGWKDVKPSKEIAGLMLSAILSDTLKFTSPTTTDEDKKAAEELAKIAEVDIEKHAAAMFEAKSDLTGMNAKDILLTDSKVFDFGNKKVRISVLETTKPQNAKDMKADIDKARDELKSSENLDAAFFFVIDILNNSADLFAGSEEEKQMAQKAFGKNFGGDFMNLPGVVSRKKQIAPKLEAVYTK